MKRLILCLAMVLGMSGQILAVGTATVTTSNTANGTVTYSVAWTSNASGAVSGNAFSVARGEIVQVRFVPGSSGSQPTNLYDITLVDPNSVDILNGSGADQSNTAGAYLIFNPPLFHEASDTLDVVIANAGNAKSGTITIWVRLAQGR